MTSEEKLFLNHLLKASVPSSYNSWPKRYGRAVEVLDQFRRRHRNDKRLNLPRATEYLQFLCGTKWPDPSLILTALREARSVAARAAALKGTAKRWERNDFVKARLTHKSQRKASRRG
jgi:hypothetical protein